MTLLRGDCLALLPTLGNASVDSIVTDPPYSHHLGGQPMTDNTQERESQHPTIFPCANCGEPLGVRNGVPEPWHASNGFDNCLNPDGTYMEKFATVCSFCNDEGYGSTMDYWGAETLWRCACNPEVEMRDGEKTMSPNQGGMMTDSTQEPWGGIALTTWRDESKNATVYVITVTDRHEIEDAPMDRSNEYLVELFNGIRMFVLKSQVQPIKRTILEGNGA